MRRSGYIRALTIVLAGAALLGSKESTVQSQSGRASAPAPAANGATGKFNPGHYLLPYLGDRQSALLGRVEEICREPALKGMELRARWATLERERHEFTFGNVEQLYERLAACQKRLLLEVWIASFDGRPDGILPNDLRPSLVKTNSGYIAKIWDASVMDRLIALYEALGERFDREPYFEGIIVSETATSRPRDPEYGATAYIVQLTRGLEAIRVAWPNTNVIVFDNYITGASDAQFEAFVRSLEKLRIGIGGPDVLPAPRRGTAGERIYRGEIGGTDFAAGCWRRLRCSSPSSAVERERSLRRSSTITVLE